MKSIWVCVWALIFAWVSIAGPPDFIQITIDFRQHKQWNNFKEKFRKNYSEAELVYRRQVWQNNEDTVKKLNDDYNSGKSTFLSGMNDYGDLTHKEFIEKLCGTKNEISDSGSQYIIPKNMKDLPEQVDWRRLGCVTAVKDQKECGSCWAFAAVGALECQHFLKTGNLIAFSEQQLVDCSRDYDNEACNGGFPANAFNYTKTNHLMCSTEYPYVNREEKCKYVKSKGIGKVTGHVRVEKGNETCLAWACATTGTLSVVIDANQPSLQFYKDGIYYDENCTKNLTHAVLLVGYGKDANGSFWLIKNSWGTSWGMSGYIKLKKDHDNHCSVATDVVFPLV